MSSLYGHCDHSWGCQKHGSLCTSSVVKALTGPVSWCVNKQWTIAVSTAEACTWFSLILFRTERSSWLPTGTNPDLRGQSSLHHNCKRMVWFRLEYKAHQYSVPLLPVKLSSVEKYFQSMRLLALVPSENKTKIDTRQALIRAREKWMIQRKNCSPNIISTCCDPNDCYKFWRWETDSSPKREDLHYEGFLD